MPIGTPHLYYAAMESKSCRLTHLGRHYWQMAQTEAYMKLGITGHQDIPPFAEDAIRQTLRRLLEETPDPITAVTSLAEGADQMFAGLTLDRGGRLHVVVPCQRYDEAFATTAGARTFTLLLARATDIETLSFPEPSEEAFWAAGRRVVELCDLLLAVWDGEPARGKGGTADVVEYARNRGVEVEVIWPPGISR